MENHHRRDEAKVTWRECQRKYYKQWGVMRNLQLQKRKDQKRNKENLIYTIRHIFYGISIGFL